MTDPFEERGLDPDLAGILDDAPEFDLPLLTPEYEQIEAAFTRRLVRDLYADLRRFERGEE